MEATSQRSSQINHHRRKNFKQRKERNASDCTQEKRYKKSRNDSLDPTREEAAMSGVSPILARVRSRHLPSQTPRLWPPHSNTHRKSAWLIHTRSWERVRWEGRTQGTYANEASFGKGCGSRQRPKKFLLRSNHRCQEHPRPGKAMEKLRET